MVMFTKTNIFLSILTHNIDRGFWSLLMKQYRNIHIKTWIIDRYMIEKKKLFLAGDYFPMLIPTASFLPVSLFKKVI